jgi:RNA-directed DNA polymerase
MTDVDSEVLRIQRMLYAQARENTDRRFKRLYKYLTHPEWVSLAIDEVMVNRGSRTAGVDGLARKHYLADEARGQLADSIMTELANETYSPRPVRRVYIPKANGQKRPLGIPTIKDRVVQELVRMLLEPIYEGTFLSCSYGFRPKRCTWDALAEVYTFLLPHQRYHVVIEGDIQDCFGTIDHGLLMKQLRRRILDKRVLRLIWKMLQAGYLEDLQYHETEAGTPQGGIVSPLLANVYMHRLDEWFHEHYLKYTAMQRLVAARCTGRKKPARNLYVRYVRYADDFVVLMRGTTEEAATLKQQVATFIREQMKMTLSEDKTLITLATTGFEFLGVRNILGAQRSSGRLMPYQLPRRKSVNAYKDAVRRITHPSRDAIHPLERMRALNWLIAGWANYHRWGNAKRTFSALKNWTIKKVHRMLRRYLSTGKRGKNRRPPGWRNTYGRFFQPVADCQNLARKYPKYTKWSTPAVRTPYGEYYGLIPMSIISTGQYWRWRGTKIPSPYAAETATSNTGQERETDFYTDTEAVLGATIGPRSQWIRGKYSFTYFQQRKLAFQRDQYTCTDCGYQSQRGKGEVHDLEAHHIDPEGGDLMDNLQTLCLPCHHKRTAIALKSA